MPTDFHPLRVVREQRGLSVRTLASRLGVAPSTISRIETWQRGPSDDLLARLADELSVDTALLLASRPVAVAS